MTDDNITLASKILKEEFLRLEDQENIISNRDKVLNNYQDIFSSEKIRNISWDQFSGFLKFENNTPYLSGYAISKIGEIFAFPRSLMSLA